MESIPSPRAITARESSLTTWDLIFRQIPFGTIRKESEEIVGDNDPQHRVTEEFKPFVIVDVLIRFVDIGPVTKSEVQEIWSPEPQTGFLLELVQFPAPRGVDSRGPQIWNIKNPGSSKHYYLSFSCSSMKDRAS